MMASMFRRGAAISLFKKNGCRRPPSLLPVVLLGCSGLLVLGALTGCRNSQTAANDPFLPFMKTRVPPPGTAAPPGGAGLDPYYQNGAAGQTPPAAVQVTPPIATPGSVPPSATDKYSPPNGFNFPQGSIDRSKAIDPKAREMKAGGTAIARRTLSTPLPGRSEVDTQLTAAKTTAANLLDSAAADHTTPAGAALDSATLDAATIAFADPAHASLADSAKPAVAKANPSAIPSAARFSQVVSDESGAAQRSTIRILTPREGSDMAGAEPEPAQATTDGTIRLRMTAGGPPGRIDSKPAEEFPDRQKSFAVADGQAGVQFRPSQPGGGVVQASWNEAVTDAASASPIAATDMSAVASTSASMGLAAPATDSYGYEPSYNSLRGKLEYSQRTRQWKLRYIPIDGTTDQFGGSVVLGDSNKLEGFKPGDFVSVRGGLASGSQDARAFSPRYDLSRIEPVR